MALFQWTPKFSVGVAEIDAQHKRLFEMTNAMFEAMKQTSGREQVLASVLRELVDYTKKHLAYEEQRLTQARYAALEQHKREHVKLMEQVKGFVDQYNAGNRNILVQLTQFMQKWLVEHISQVDMLYSKTLCGAA